MLTDRNIEVLNFIHQFRRAYGVSPTIKEIAKGVNLRSTSSAMRHVDRLINLGVITHIPSSPRTIQLTEKGLDLILLNDTSKTC